MDPIDSETLRETRRAAVLASWSQQPQAAQPPAPMSDGASQTPPITTPEQANAVLNDPTASLTAIQAAQKVLQAQLQELRRQREQAEQARDQNKLKILDAQIGALECKINALKAKEVDRKTGRPNNQVVGIDPMTGRTASLTAKQWEEKAKLYEDAAKNEEQAQRAEAKANSGDLRPGDVKRATEARDAADAAWKRVAIAECKARGQVEPDSNGKVRGMNPFTGQMVEWTPAEWYAAGVAADPNATDDEIIEAYTRLEEVGKQALEEYKSLPDPPAVPDNLTGREREKAEEEAKRVAERKSAAGNRVIAIRCRQNALVAKYRSRHGGGPDAKVEDVDFLTSSGSDTRKISLTADQWNERADLHQASADATLDALLKESAEKSAPEQRQGNAALAARAARADANKRAALLIQATCYAYADIKPEPGGDGKVAGTHPFTGQPVRLTPPEWRQLGGAAGKQATSFAAEGKYHTASAGGASQSRLDDLQRDWAIKYFTAMDAQSQFTLDLLSKQEVAFKKEEEKLSKEEQELSVKEADYALSSEERARLTEVRRLLGNTRRELAKIRYAKQDNSFAKKELQDMARGRGALNPRGFEAGEFTRGPATVADPAGDIPLKSGKNLSGETWVWEYPEGFDPTFNLDPSSPDCPLKKNPVTGDYEGEVTYKGRTYYVFVHVVMSKSGDRVERVEVQYYDKDCPESLRTARTSVKSGDSAHIWVSGLRDNGDPRFQDKADPDAFDHSHLVGDVDSWLAPDRVSLIDANYKSAQENRDKTVKDLEAARAARDQARINQLTLQLAEYDRSIAEYEAKEAFKEVDRLIRSGASEADVDRAYIEAKKKECSFKEKKAEYDHAKWKKENPGKAESESPYLKEINAARQQRGTWQMRSDGYGVKDPSARLGKIAQTSIDNFYASFGTDAIDIESDGHLQNVVIFALFGPPPGEDWSSLSPTEVRKRLKEGSFYGQLTDEQKAQVDKVVNQIRDEGGPKPRIKVLRGLGVLPNGELGSINLFRVEGKGGGRLVDGADGSVFNDLEDWKSNNCCLLPDSAFALPTDPAVGQQVVWETGPVGKAGSLLVSPLVLLATGGGPHKTTNTSGNVVLGSSGHVHVTIGRTNKEAVVDKWMRDHQTEVAIGTLFVGLVLLIPTGGASTGLMAGLLAARAVVAAATAYGAAQSATALIDAAQHGRSLTDAEAWINWLNLAASILPLGSLGRESVGLLMKEARALRQLERAMARSQKAARSAEKSGQSSVGAQAEHMKNYEALYSGQGAAFRKTVNEFMQNNFWNLVGRVGYWLGGASLAGNALYAAARWSTMLEKEKGETKLNMAINFVSMIPFHRGTNKVAAKMPERQFQQRSVAYQKYLTEVDWSVIKSDLARFNKAGFNERDSFGLGLSESTAMAVKDFALKGRGQGEERPLQVQGVFPVRPHAGGGEARAGASALPPRAVNRGDSAVLPPPGGPEARAAVSPAESAADGQKPASGRNRQGRNTDGAESTDRRRRASARQPRDSHGWRGVLTRLHDVRARMRGSRVEEGGALAGAASAMVLGEAQSAYFVGHQESKGWPIYDVQGKRVAYIRHSPPDKLGIHFADLNGVDLTAKQVAILQRGRLLKPPGTRENLQNKQDIHFVASDGVDLTAEQVANLPRGGLVIPPSMPVRATIGGMVIPRGEPGHATHGGMVVPPIKPGQGPYFFKSRSVKVKEDGSLFVDVHLQSIFFKAVNGTQERVLSPEEVTALLDPGNVESAAILAAVHKELGTAESRARGIVVLDGAGLPGDIPAVLAITSGKQAIRGLVPSLPQYTSKTGKTEMGRFIARRTVTTEKMFDRFVRHLPRFMRTVLTHLHLWKPGKGHERTLDAEKSFFEQMHRMLAEHLLQTGKLPGEINGTVRIFVDRPVCRSCRAVKGQFSLDYPNVTVEIIHVPRRASETENEAGAPRAAAVKREDVHQLRSDTPTPRRTAARPGGAPSSRHVEPHRVLDHGSGPDHQIDADHVHARFSQAARSLLERLNTLPRAIELGGNHEASSPEGNIEFNVRQAIGARRIEQAFGIRLRPSDTHGADFHGPAHHAGRTWRNISLNGPIFKHGSLEPLPLVQQRQSIANIRQHVIETAGVDVHVVDLFGLDAAVAADMVKALTAPSVQRVLDRRGARVEFIAGEVSAGRPGDLQALRQTELGRLMFSEEHPAPGRASSSHARSDGTQDAERVAPLSPGEGPHLAAPSRPQRAGPLRGFAQGNKDFVPIEIPGAGVVAYRNRKTGEYFDAGDGTKLTRDEVQDLQATVALVHYVGSGRRSTALKELKGSELLGTRVDELVLLSATLRKQFVELGRDGWTIAEREKGLAATDHSTKTISIDRNLLLNARAGETWAVHECMRILAHEFGHAQREALDIDVPVERYVRDGLHHEAAATRNELLVRGEILAASARDGAQGVDISPEAYARYGAMMRIADAPTATRAIAGRFAADEATDIAGIRGYKEGYAGMLRRQHDAYHSGRAQPVAGGPSWNGFGRTASPSDRPASTKGWRNQVRPNGEEATALQAHERAGVVVHAVAGRRAGADAAARGLGEAVSAPVLGGRRVAGRVVRRAVRNVDELVSRRPMVAPPSRGEGPLLAAPSSGRMEKPQNVTGSDDAAIVSRAVAKQLRKGQPVPPTKEQEAQIKYLTETPAADGRARLGTSVSKRVRAWPRDLKGGFMGANRTHETAFVVVKRSPKKLRAQSRLPLNGDTVTYAYGEAKAIADGFVSAGSGRRIAWIYRVNTDAAQLRQAVDAGEIPLHMIEGAVAVLSNAQRSTAAMSWMNPAAKGVPAVGDAVVDPPPAPTRKQAAGVLLKSFGVTLATTGTTWATMRYANGLPILSDFHNADFTQWAAHYLALGMGYRAGAYMATYVVRARSGVRAEPLQDRFFNGDELPSQLDYGQFHDIYWDRRMNQLTGGAAQLAPEKVEAYRVAINKAREASQSLRKDPNDAQALQALKGAHATLKGALFELRSPYFMRGADRVVHAMRGFKWDRSHGVERWARSRSARIDKFFHNVEDRRQRFLDAHAQWRQDKGDLAKFQQMRQCYIELFEFMTTGWRGAVRGISRADRRAVHLAVSILRRNPGDASSVKVMTDVVQKMFNPETPMGRALLGLRMLSLGWTLTSVSQIGVKPSMWVNGAAMWSAGSKLIDSLGTVAPAWARRGGVQPSEHAQGSEPGKLGKSRVVPQTRGDDGYERDPETGEKVLDKNGEPVKRDKVPLRSRLKLYTAGMDAMPFGLLALGDSLGSRYQEAWNAMPHVHDFRSFAVVWWPVAYDGLILAPYAVLSARGLWKDWKVEIRGARGMGPATYVPPRWAEWLQPSVADTYMYKDLARGQVYARHDQPVAIRGFHPAVPYGIGGVVVALGLLFRPDSEEVDDKTSAPPLPTGPGTPPQSPPSPPPQPPTPSPIVVVVQPDDSLWDIARKHGPELLGKERYEQLRAQGEDVATQAALDELMRRNPQRGFKPSLRDGWVSNDPGDPDYIEEGEAVTIA